MFGFLFGIFEDLKRTFWFLDPNVLINWLLDSLGIYAYLGLFLIVFADRKSVV